MNHTIAFFILAIGGVILVGITVIPSFWAKEGQLERWATIGLRICSFIVGAICLIKVFGLI